MKEPLLRNFDEINDTGIAIAGYTSGLCGEWTPERFEIFARELEIERKNIIVANEKHTDKVRVIKDNLIYDEFDYFDAMITDKKGIMLCVHTADCVPIVFLDPIKKVVGIAHSGWVGSSKKIAGKTITKMIREFNCSPENIICCLGPYNHSCCYEVGADVLEKFRENFSEDECKKLFAEKNDGKFMLDLGLAVSMSLISEGISEKNIFDSGHCTFHTDEFSSWRRTGDYKNQILTYIMMK